MADSDEEKSDIHNRANEIRKKVNSGMVKGAGGAYRLLGNKTKSGEIFGEVFEKTH